MKGKNVKIRLNDLFLSLLSGLLLVAAARVSFDLLVGLLPDAAIMSGGNPILRLSLARLALFALVVAIVAIPFAWPLRYAELRDPATTLPGAACAAVLYYLLARVQYFHPFPAWLDVARALLLFVALPLAASFWWRGRRD